MKAALLILFAFAFAAWLQELAGPWENAFASDDPAQGGCPSM